MECTRHGRFGKPLGFETPLKIYVANGCRCSSPFLAPVSSSSTPFRYGSRRCRRGKGEQARGLGRPRRLPSSGSRPAWCVSKTQSLRAPFESVHAGVAPGKLVDFFERRLREDAAKEEGKRGWVSQSTGGRAEHRQIRQVHWTLKHWVICFSFTLCKECEKKFAEEGAVGGF